MFSRVRIAIRFFFVGLAVGILLAPRSGEETRRMLREKADQLLNDVLDAATLGTAQTGGGRTGGGGEASRVVDEEADAPASATATNGGARTRTRTASSSAGTSS
jgi:YtxH-like protein